MENEMYSKEINLRAYHSVHKKTGKAQRSRVDARNLSSDSIDLSHYYKCRYCDMYHVSSSSRNK